jgi:hypothetical protein
MIRTLGDPARGRNVDIPDNIDQDFFETVRRSRMLPQNDPERAADWRDVIAHLLVGEAPGEAAVEAILDRHALPLDPRERSVRT